MDWKLKTASECLRVSKSIRKENQNIKPQPKVSKTILMRPYTAPRICKQPLGQLISFSFISTSSIKWRSCENRVNNLMARDFIQFQTLKTPKTPCAKC